VSLHLGLDVGTQGTKGLVVDADAGVIVARASAEYGLIEGLEPGAAEQHPDTWTDAIRAVAAELMAADGVDPSAFASVGVSGQQHGLVVLDGEGQVVRPSKLWCDTSTAEEARELSETLGHPVPTGFTASKILWMARHEPEAWARVARVFLPHDYVNWLLTDRACMEAGDASGTGFFDPEARDFRAADVQAIDPRLADLLPELIGAGQAAGTLCPRGAELLGLPEGVLVSAGGGDNMMSAVGSGASRPGVVVVSLGTSGTVFTHTLEPVVDPAGLIAPFCASVGGWLPLLCVMNLTAVSEEVSSAFRRDHASLTDAARGVPIGCDGLLWLPYLAGERVPDLPDATGTLLGMRAGHLSPEVLYRAALEGTSLNLAWGVERMRSLGVGVDAVHLVGGAARNALWREILADLLNCPVTPLAEPESGALGAALQGLWTWRLAQDEAVEAHQVAEPYIAAGGPPTEPDAERSALYGELGQRFRDEVRARYGDV
jgi:D-xylulose kinase